jgi:prepilin-type N-terminal cleavage/methylation domain-containing protein
LFRSLLKEEHGYSLIEVMVSMIILAVAILPMMSMFGMGLHGVTASSNYDKARTLANLKLEQAKNVPFAEVEDNFPEAGITTPYDGSDWFDPGADFTGFQYTVVKDYMQEWDPTNQDASRDFVTSDTPTDLIRVTVTVQWSDGEKTYTTHGLVAG